MIGVLARAGQAGAVEEFFELFKTPWEFYRPGKAYDVIITTMAEVPEVAAKLLIVCGRTTTSLDSAAGITHGARHQSAILSDQNTSFPVYGELVTFAGGGKGVACVTAGADAAVLRFEQSDYTFMRLGYDLFDEVAVLLTAGQPLQHASIPTLDIHINLLRQWILQTGIPLLEIPPFPAGHDFVVCLTHDIDFVGIRNHKFDHTMLGFLNRATVGALYNTLRGRLSLAQLIKSWLAAASLPFVYLGWAKDFWEPFAWYLEVEKGIPSTYFLIPFKRRAGENVPGPHASRRATAYDISDLSHWTAVLLRQGCELGVHGIDSWHSEERGRNELATVSAVSGESSIGIRMHWLLQNSNTLSTLEKAGYAYDSTCGYNETVGYRAGTSQVFRPFGAQTLLELPLHIQDGALFYPQRLDLSRRDAEERCQTLFDNATELGGIVTLLWHDRSHGPERFWGDFYIGLIKRLKSLNPWFGTARQVVGWFAKRRQVSFEMKTSSGFPTRVVSDGEEIKPPLRVRLHAPVCRIGASQSTGKGPSEFMDIPWNGLSVDELETRISTALSSMTSDPALCSLR